MSEFLLDVPVSLSPRLQWMKDHEVRTHECVELNETPWSAWLPVHDWSETENGCYHPDNEEVIGFGLTEDAAIVEMAKRNGLKLWNEEKP